MLEKNKTRKNKKLMLFTLFGLFLPIVLQNLPFSVSGTITGDSPPGLGDWIIDDTTVVENEYIIWNSSILIQGSADATFINTTILFNTTTLDEKISATTTGIVNFTNCTFKAYNAENPLYEPFCIDISNSVENFIMQDCFVEDYGTSFERNILIRSKTFLINNSFKKGYYGLYLYGLGIDLNRYAIIEDNTFEDQDAYDIRTQYYDNITIENNVFLGSFQSFGGGYNISDCENVTFKGNLIQHGQKQFAYHEFNDITLCIVSNNEFIGSSADITLNFCTNGGINYNIFNGTTFSIKMVNCTWISGISHNTFVDCYTGTYIVGSKDPGVIRNTFTNMEKAAVQIRSYCETATVAENVIEYSDEYGIFVYYTAGCLISDNNVSYCAHQGIFVQYSANANIYDNIVTQCGWTGIDLYDADDSWVERNICKENGRNGIQIEATEGGSINDNTCTGNTQSGMQIKSSSGVIVADNFLCHNYGDGLYVSYGSYEISVNSNDISYNEGSGILVDEDSEANIGDTNTVEMNGDGDINDGSIDWLEILKWVAIGTAVIVFEIILVKVVKKKK
ncbi:MAG: hypothetical protein GF364_03175 [Candidatus Lokiarchaeota archaeon]|nr:hypothetical protein [Candidatus Lokiarchaeota archaeon]